MAIIPIELSRFTNNAAQRRIRIVTGMAAMVRANSVSFLFVTMTRNWIVKPRKKKRSNLSSAM
jgi:hypothetical protein